MSFNLPVMVAVLYSHYPYLVEQPLCGILCHFLRTCSTYLSLENIRYGDHRAVMLLVLRFEFHKFPLSEFLRVGDAIA